jgi:protein-S-isoprenylcysteine O-methyltransferase Ste14
MEEKRMQRRFGDDYRQYERKDVPRFFPALGNVGAAVRTTRPFDWAFAWRKEYESCCGWLAGVAALEVYEGVWWHGWQANWPATIRWLVVLVSIGVVSLILAIQKRAQRR